MFNKQETTDFLKQLLSIHSPSGYTQEAIQFLQKEIEALGYSTSKNQKGNLLVHVPGKSSKTVGLSGHVDTLGLMVRSIHSDGTLALTAIGGPLTPTLDGEYCTIITRENQTYTGTILSKSPSIHVYPDAASKPRDIDNLIVKIDEKVTNKEEVKKLGIQNGDIIAYDPKVEITKSGFIKSRFLDDKASVSILFSLLKTLKTNHIIPKDNLIFIFSTYEEVGHGAAHIPPEITELLALDMGCIGLDLACTEYDVSICAKDSSGPYDYEMTTRLIQLAKEKELNYAVDIYPRYGSDASAALRGGRDIKAALIGPGVSSSHGMERTHIDALENTFKLVLATIQ